MVGRRGSFLVIGFNSQRDEILLCNKSKKHYLSARFNSQRDEILLINFRVSGSCFYVSIPNGMKFYSSFSYRLCWICLVSIPNGMKFYRIKLKKKLQTSLFQFPAGWNSTKHIVGLLLFSLVSIPNGMKFYKIRDEKTVKFRCFNSQRDEILH